MTSTDKQMTWTRWTVVVSTTDVAATYSAVYNIASNQRFSVRTVSDTGADVRAVVEYTAAGANADDIKRRFMKAGMDRSSLTVRKVASVETDWKCNSDLVSAVSREHSPADEVRSAVSAALRQSASGAAMQVTWALSEVEAADDPLDDGVVLIPEQDYVREAKESAARASDEAESQPPSSTISASTTSSSPELTSTSTWLSEPVEMLMGGAAGGSTC